MNNVKGFDNIAVLGVGLIGGSIGLAAKKRGLTKHVTGIGRNEEKLAHAEKLGAIDDYTTDVAEGVREANVIFVCTPVQLIPKFVGEVAENAKPGAIITDVGSTKSYVVIESTRNVPDGVHFVGGHPMAGSEQAGVDSAQPDLYEGATWVITPTPHTDESAVKRLADFTTALGAITEIMDPSKHDMSAATMSHLPHVLAAALMINASDQEKDLGTVYKLGAGSFRDATRVSESMPEIWRDICITNSTALQEILEHYIADLNDFSKLLSSRNQQAIFDFFSQAREARIGYQEVKNEKTDNCD